MTRFPNSEKYPRLKLKVHAQPDETVYVLPFSHTSMSAHFRIPGCHTFRCLIFFFFFLGGESLNVLCGGGEVKRNKLDCRPTVVAHVTQQTQQ